MADFGVFPFASPTKFSDWASYAGFNRTTGQFEGIPDSAPEAGVKPPASLGEYAQQKIAPVVNKMQAVVPAAQQMMQGNFSQGMGTLKAAAPSQQINKTLAPVSTYDYTVGLEPQ